MIYGYARVSDKSQEIGTQIEELKKYGCDEIVDEAVIGVSKERKLFELVEKMKPSDSLVVTRLDRLGRSASQLLVLVDDLQERRIRLVILDLNVDTSTPMGRFFLQVMAAFSEMDRAYKKERQKAGIALARKKNIHLGRKREGWNNSNLELALGYYEEGNMTIKEICEVTGVSKASLYRYLKKEV